MTGRELIVYILQNNLEDEEIFKDGKCICVLSEEEVAVRFGVGPETVKVMEKLDLIRGFKIGDTTYYPKNLRDPRLVWPASGGNT